jgi:hypothetical protein
MTGCIGDGVRRDDYVEKNEELLASVPTFPGAQRTDVRHSPYYEGDSAGAPVAGYVTAFVFRLPEDVSRVEVGRFYERRLSREWVLVEEFVEAGGERVVNFRREDASLSINLESRGVLELAVDHNSYGKLGRPE